ncbi:hypothetical protein F4780DRAFT_345937 [Xylariomycetidae sp. FL0641]|nr:hypothetical protein F4780DRAFT_345937 [Xylariomycetidae sp. FL0641]
MSTESDPECGGIEVWTWTPGNDGFDQYVIEHDTVQQEPGPLRTEEVAGLTIFLHTADKESGVCRACLAYMSGLFQFASRFWRPALEKSNGHFAHQDDFDADGNAIGLSTYSKFLLHRFEDDTNPDTNSGHDFRDITLFTHWLKETGQTRVFFLRTEDCVLEEVRSSMLELVKQRGLHDPLWMYPIVLDLYINLQHKAAFEIRDRTMKKEQEAEDFHTPLSMGVYAPSHRVARSAMVVCEILLVNIKTLESIVHCHEDYVPESVHGSANVGEAETDPYIQSVIVRRKTHQYLLFHAHMVYSMHCRCHSYLERMRNVINLTFNMVAQDDARAMKMMSICALLFLPASFVTTVFSTTFFQFGDDASSWAVSSSIWIYVLSMALFSLVCMCVWSPLIGMNRFHGTAGLRAKKRKLSESFGELGSLGCPDSHC